MTASIVDQGINACRASFYRATWCVCCLGDLDLERGKRLARQTVKLIKDSVVGRMLITARKE